MTTSRVASGPLSAYDEASPFAALPAALRAKFATIRAARPAADLAAARDVVAVVSSSRGGSTLLAELLRRMPGLVTLPGEVNPHVSIARGAGDPTATLVAELAREAGAPAARVAAADVDGFALACWWRLTAQWPDVDLDRATVTAAVRRALADVGGHHAEAWADDGASFTARLLRGLRARHPAIDPARYDLPAAALRSAGSVGERSGGPTSETVVEMAPYRLFRPWRQASDEEVATRPLVVVTPRNAYRLDHLSGLLPGARLRVVHLTRNPAATVNGLMDGWQHPGFFAGVVDAPLRIAGYSDAHAWGDRWWKFDLPPGWRAVTGADLAEVAALQWRSAHAAVLDFVARTRCDCLTVRYEDLVGPRASRVAVADDIAEWLGVPRDTAREVVVGGFRPVMATGAPAPRRWARSADRIAAALAEPRVWDVVAALGYGVEAHDWS